VTFKKINMFNFYMISYTYMHLFNNTVLAFAMAAILVSLTGLLFSSPLAEKYT